MGSRTYLTDPISAGIHPATDLLVSSLYVRASSKLFCRADFADYSFEQVISLHDGFNQQYYISHSEAISVSERLLSDIDANILDMNKIIHMVDARVDLLRDYVIDVNRDLPPSRILRDLTVLNTGIYEYCRIPENLDRGSNLFTQAILRDLQSQHDLTRDRAMNYLTERMYKSFSSPLRRYDNALEDVKKEFVASLKYIPPSRNAKQIEMELIPDFLSRLDHIVAEYGHLRYQGVAGTPMSSRLDVIRDLIQRSSYSYRRRRQDQTDTGLHLAPKLENKINLYLNIHRSKLRRKSIQLMSFEVADQNISRVAASINLPERRVRMLLPEELLYYIDIGVDSGVILPDRRNCIHRINGRTEIVLSESSERRIALISGALAKREDQCLQDQPISVVSGRASGVALVLDDFYTGPFDDERFDHVVIFAKSPDAEIVPALRRCRGLVVAQSGVTSHLSLICRELGVPTIAGAAALIRTVRTGDHVLVDADHCAVKVVESPVSMPVKSPASPLPIGRGETKLDFLELLRSLGLNVPPFWGLNARDVSADSEACADKILRHSKANHFILRSNFADEERAENMKFGQYESVFPVSRTGLSSALVDYLARIERSGSGSEQHVVLVQEFIDGDFSGVALSGIADAPGTAIVEMVMGANAPLTSGMAAPAGTIIFRSDDLGIERVSGVARSFPLASELVKDFSDLARALGSSIACEWTCSDAILYWLQVRPI